MIHPRNLCLLAVLLPLAAVIAEEALLPAIPAMEPTQEVRAQIVPIRTTVLSSGLAARISDLPLREGDRFEKGDILLALDCGLHRARLAKAGAVLAEARKTWEVNSRLGELRSLSTLEVDVSAARLAGAEADQAIVQIQVNECDVRAPFSGRLSRVEVKRYQYVAEGEPLFELLDDSELEVEMIVPSRWLQWLDVGTELSVNIEELSSVRSAQVARIGARIDPVSQSVKVFATLSDSSGRLMAGMSGAARFPVATQ